MNHPGNGVVLTLYGGGDHRIVRDQGLGELLLIDHSSHRQNRKFSAIMTLFGTGIRIREKGL